MGERIRAFAQAGRGHAAGPFGERRLRPAPFEVIHGRRDWRIRAQSRGGGGAGGEGAGGGGGTGTAQSRTLAGIASMLP